MVYGRFFYAVKTHCFSFGSITCVMLCERWEDNQACRKITDLRISIRVSGCSVETSSPGSGNGNPISARLSIASLLVLYVCNLVNCTMCLEILVRACLEKDLFPGCGKRNSWNIDRKIHKSANFTIFFQNF